MDSFIVGCSHYGHRNICRGTSQWESGFRDIDSLELMNQTIVNNINARVGHNDILYHLGDWSFGGYDNIKLFREQINCKTVHLCLGNHDEHIREDKKNELKQLFASVNDILEINFGKQKAVLCHYPFVVWNKSHHKVWNLHSHSHGSLPDNINTLRIDCGFDCEYYVNNKNKLIMTTNYNLSPVFKNGTVEMEHKTPKKTDKILHPRFFPFDFAEISRIMLHKSNRPVDHHCRKDQQ